MNFFVFETSKKKSVILILEISVSSINAHRPYEMYLVWVTIWNACTHVCVYYSINGFGWIGKNSSNSYKHIVHKSIILTFAVCWVSLYLSLCHAHADTVGSIAIVCNMAVAMRMFPLIWHIRRNCVYGPSNRSTDDNDKDNHIAFCWCAFTVNTVCIPVLHDCIVKHSMQSASHSRHCHWIYTPFLLLSTY